MSPPIELIPVSEARKRLPELVKRAAAGESFTVTLNGFPMATLTSTNPTVAYIDHIQEVHDAGKRADPERDRGPGTKAAAVAPEASPAGAPVAEAPVEDFFAKRDRERVEAARKRLENKK